MSDRKPKPADAPPEKFAWVVELMGMDEVEAQSHRIMREVIRKNEEAKAEKRPTGWERPKPGA